MQTDMAIPSGTSGNWVRSYSRRRTLWLTDPTPVTPGLQLRRNRGVRCSRFDSLHHFDSNPPSIAAEDSKSRLARSGIVRPNIRYHTMLP